MSDGVQTVFRQFVVGPAQRASARRRKRFYPDLEAIAGPSDALTEFVRLAKESPTLEVLASAFSPRAADAEVAVGEAAVADRFPGAADVMALLDGGRFAEGAALLREHSSDIERLRAETELLHAALLAYLVEGRTSPVGENALKLLKLIWLATLPEDLDAPDFAREFWKAGAPSVQVKLPRSADDVWAAAGPAAERARRAKAPAPAAPSPPGAPSAAELAAARTELDFLHRIQGLAAIRERRPAAAPAPPAPEPRGLLSALLPNRRERVAVASSVTAEQRPGQELLGDEGRERMSDPVRTTIERIGFDPQIHTVQSMLDGIDAAHRMRLSDGKPGTQVGTIHVGGRWVEIDSELFGAPLCDEPRPDCHCDLLVELDSKHGGKPRIHVLGSGRAYRIDQTHERYLPGQIVHTENHEKGAKRNMSFRRLERAEQTDETETEAEEFREAETTSHDQFETSKEISKAAQQQAEMSAGISTTASYGYTGGSASLSGHYDVSSANAAQTSEKIATRQAKEIISRAVESVKQRSRTRRVVTSLTETERVESFKIDNSGSASRTDFYRAIDQEYRNQLVTVGERVMVRVTLQEPMAWLLYALAQRTSAGQILTEPVKPTVGPANINAGNYASLASLYEAKGIRPPPADVMVSLDLHNPVVESPWINKSGLIEIPDGLMAHYAAVNMLRGFGGGSYISVAVGQGSATWSGPGGLQWWNVNGEQDAIAYAVRAHDNEFSLTLSVYCKPTAAAVEKWQIEVHDAIMTAYRAKRDAYEAQLQAAAFSGGPGVDERNPATNRVLIEQELQKFVLGATYPPTYFRSFDSMKFAADCDNPRGGTIPEPDFMDAWSETPWITFLSQLYEWKNMTYQFLPYSYGKRSHWRTLRGRTSNDPYFERAITAGAIIIDLPVAEHMTSAFLWFMETGKIWSGGDMPILGEPGYQDLAIAIRDSEVKDGDPVGEPWFTRVPTSLVYIEDNVPFDL